MQQFEPIHAQRLAALRIAVERKQQFDSIAELRRIKRMTVLSHLLEFTCATAKNLLILLDQKNNAVLSQMAKDGLIRIARWQNAQVYVPTASGKAWLLAALEDAQEIERVRSTPVRRKITGVSSEHDLGLQNAAIKFAVRHGQKTGRNWRVFKPRKQQVEGKVPDAMVVFTRPGEVYAERIAIEYERTRKTPVGVVASLSRLIDFLCLDEGDEVRVFSQSPGIVCDYLAARIAVASEDDGGLGMDMPRVEMLRTGAVPVAALGAGGRLSDHQLGAASRIRIGLVDAEGQAVPASGLIEQALFNRVFWQISLYQSQPVTWQEVARRAADALDLDAARLLRAFGGPHGEDNPMRSADDRERAAARWAQPS